METLARIYSGALFEVAGDQGKLDLVHEQLNQFADAVAAERMLAVFLFSPQFSTQERKEGIERILYGADPIFVNFLHALIDKHRMPVIHRIRDRYNELWASEHKLLGVQVTSAIELDQSTLDEIARRIEGQTGRRVELERRVDDDILGGLVIRVGNLIMDASVRNQLERLRKQVARAA